VRAGERREDTPGEEGKGHGLKLFSTASP
jgi:hypothetical protein